MSAPVILFACGGSGGHIFPAVAVAEELERRIPGISILFISGEREIENEIFRTLGDRRVTSIPGGRNALGLMHSLIWAVQFLKRKRPGIVVGFGGYVSAPVVIAARLAGIPVLIHEQNVVPGVANRLLARWASGAALSFEETRPRIWSRRLRVTGNPIRLAIERDCRREALDFFGFSSDKKTLLVLGGSQGAESVNTLILEAAGFLSAEDKRSTQILHLCGRMKPEESERRFEKEGVAARSFSFFDRMDLAYGAADLAVGRAGATFLAEMEARGLSAICVTYPYAGAHQLANAEVVAKRTGATVAEQKNLDGKKLAALLGNRLGEIGKPSAFRLPPPTSNARALLADFILELMEKR